MARGGGDKEEGTRSPGTVGTNGRGGRPGDGGAWLWRHQPPEAVPSRANQSGEVGGGWPISVQSRTRKGAAASRAVGAAGAGVRVPGRAKAAEAGKAASGSGRAAADFAEQLAGEMVMAAKKGPGPGGGVGGSKAEAEAASEVWCRRVRELGGCSQAGNRHCFECAQRGVTYVDITVGSFVCTTCSGLL